MSVDERERDRIARANVESVLAATPAFDASTIPGTRVTVRGRVLACHSCDLVDQLPKGCRPVPPHHPYGASFAVLGEAPASNEHRTGLGFTGKSGMLLRQSMIAAGWTREQLSESIAWGNVVQCWPRVDGKPMDARTPTEFEQAKCRPHVARWLGGIDAVLLVGATALGQWRADLTVEQMHGVVGVWTRDDGTRRTVMCVRHPAGILRALDARDKKMELIEELTVWKGIVDDARRGLPATRHMGHDCPECRNTNRELVAGNVTWIDPDGIGWCKSHAEGTGARGKLGRGYDRWAGVRKAWGKPTQEGMF